MDHVLEGKRLLPDTIAAPRIGVQVQTLRNWRYLGIGPPYIRIGSRAIRYDKDDLEKYVAMGKVDPTRREK
jgi:hypothetical protein